MLTKTDTLLSKMIIEKGLVSPDLVQSVLDEAAKSKESFFSLFSKKRLLSEDQMLGMLSELLKLPLIDLANLKPDPAAIEKVPLKFAEYYQIVPIKFEKRKLTLAISAPLDLRTQDDIRAHLGTEIEVALAKEKEILEAIQRFYGFAAGTISEMMAVAPPSAGPDTTQAELGQIENIEKMAGDASIAKLVNQIIFEAYKKRATDIHIEPYRGKVKLRYRIDGILYNAHVQSEMSRFIMPILSRIKIMSNLNIVEKRLPQDGRAIVKVEDTTLDLRVSSIPTPYGESVVIRMLPMNRVFNLTQLGLSSAQFKIFEDLIKKPHGIIFITGPTGSGKSTTLYACLNKINTDARKIITIEDPVEYEMEGVTQIQVIPAIGLDFARGLRSMLRHDPDVMMVGEVRDLETSEIAIRVALTGHLVFSTLHTNDASSGITRLVDIGVEPYLVASSVESFIAQRLVRVICPDCKEKDDSPTVPEIKKQILRELGIKKNKEFTVYHGRGCNKCNATGFLGRVAIYEILLVNEKIKSLIVRRSTANEIKQEAIASGMRTLRQDGWLKVMDGITTPEEILKVAEEDKDKASLNLETEMETEGDSLARDKAKPPVPGSAPRYGEKRIFMRLSAAVNVLYKVIKLKEFQEKAASSEVYTVSKNISAGGILYVTKESIPAGAILELKLEVPDGEAPIECLAKVVREEALEFEESYEIAVCFLDLSAKDRSRLERFVESEVNLSP